MLLKYLSEEEPNILISALFLISIPHWGKNGWDVEDFEMRKSFGTEQNHINKVYLYHSENDTIVPFEHLNFYKSALPHATIRILKRN
ncbi:MAG: hypothetical protein H7Y13_02480 [Sphingobacteriaceae bacterium]|nr:hypothetical protein [Sphingobacteriaceae bacterium]